jgi:hypothetical protein
MKLFPPVPSALPHAPESGLQGEMEGVAKKLGAKLLTQGEARLC